MAKRKAGVNDIIYELDNDDSEISSEDEVNQPKISRIEDNNSPNSTQSDSNTQSSCLEVIDVDSPTENIIDVHSPKNIRNGGKSPVEFIIVDEVSGTDSSTAPAPEIERDKKINCSDTIFNEDIIVDSPGSNSDPGVVGCENRTPLVTVKFKDSKLAMSYKKQIKDFMLSLIKLHENNAESDNETDLELDIWPEDLEESNEEPEEPADNLFFFDTDPTGDMPIEIPSYSQNTALICNPVEKQSSPPPMLRRKGPICFNCNGNHTMRECTEPWNNARIAENRKAMVKKGRYHVEDEQKYGHLIPGRISGQLRHALGLKRYELPMHIYRMRQLGYPPGWLEEARISHSGITLFDSTGQATLDPEDEEGEVCEPGSKDKFDIKKIHDFPGFNVPASTRYKEECQELDMPAMSAADSKLAMLAVLAPNAMQAYKRKKLALCPAPAAAAPLGAAEMDLDSGDETAEFPSQPPLPDEAPPPPPATPPPPPEEPPPPPQPPTDEKQPTANGKQPATDGKQSATDGKQPATNGKQPATDEKKLSTDAKAKSTDSQDDSKKEVSTESDDDLEVVEVMKVGDIPVPMADIITIDVDGEVSEPESGRASPSLDDLERKKRLLLDALGTDRETIAVDDEQLTENKQDDEDTEMTEPTETSKDDGQKAASDVKIIDEKTDDSGKPDDKVEDDSNKTDSNSLDKGNDKDNSPDKGKDNSPDKGKDNSPDKENDKDIDKMEVQSDKPDATSSTANTEGTPKASSQSTDNVPKTPLSTMGLVRDTEYGTPVINGASSYTKLPSDYKFAKDICDVINFENLPNSIGKYKKISTLLKKVKSEVDRIQES